MGWFLAIIAGGIAGWIAEKVMRSDMGLIANIVLGMVGAVVGSAIIGFFTDFNREAGFLAYLVAGVVGACILIALWRAIKGRPVRN